MIRAIRAPDGSGARSDVRPPCLSQRCPPCRRGPARSPRRSRGRGRCPARRGLVGAREPLEGAHRELRREPRPSSRTWSSTASPTARAESSTAPSAVFERVVDEVPSACSSRACRLRLGPRSARRPSTRRCSREARSAKRSAVVRASSSRATRLDPEPERVLVGPGHEEQVVREEGEPIGLLRRGAHRCSELVSVRGRRSASSSSVFRRARAYAAHGSRRQQNAARARGRPRAAPASR